MFSRFRSANMTVAAAKCAFGTTEVEYLGYRITPTGLFPLKKKTMAVSRWQWPQTLSEMRSFLGLTSHFRKFVKGYADLVRPLRELTKATVKSWPKEPNDDLHQR